MSVLIFSAFNASEAIIHRSFRFGYEIDFVETAALTKEVTY